MLCGKSFMLPMCRLVAENAQGNVGQITKQLTWLHSNDPYNNNLIRLNDLFFINFHILIACY